jgi:ABC-type multidrug transport system fused ATPase/permease subunit
MSTSYAEEGRPILCDISLQVPAGKMVALSWRIGRCKPPNELLPRFHDPVSGEVLWMASTRDAKLPSLRRQIALVTQRLCCLMTPFVITLPTAGQTQLTQKLKKLRDRCP